MPLRIFEEVSLASKFLESRGKLEGSLTLRRKEATMSLELDHQDWLELNYCGQAEILRRLERLEEALALLEKQ